MRWEARSHALRLYLGFEEGCVDLLWQLQRALGKSTRQHGQVISAGLALVSTLTAARGASQRQRAEQ